MSMGHGDELVIADGNFPSASLARRLLRADGHGVPPLLDAILQLLSAGPLRAARRGAHGGGPGRHGEDRHLGGVPSDRPPPRPVVPGFRAGGAVRLLRTGARRLRDPCHERDGHLCEHHTEERPREAPRSRRDNEETHERRDGSSREESEEDIITRIAWLYYKEKLTQQQIAERVSLSRQKVQRLLEKARDLEIIQFTLKHPYVNLMSVESEIRQKYGLKDAVVAPRLRVTPTDLRRAFAMAGAAYLERKLATHARSASSASGGATRRRTWPITSSRSR